MYILFDPLVYNEWASSWRSIKENFIFTKEKGSKFCIYHFLQLNIV